MCVSGFISKKYNLSVFLKLFMLTTHFVRWNENKMLSMHQSVFVIFLKMFFFFFFINIFLGLQRKIRIGRETGNTQYLCLIVHLFINHRLFRVKHLVIL